MSGKKEKKKSFKDILRNSFPVDMDGLLGEQAEDRPPHAPSPSVPVDSEIESETISSRDTAPTQGTVSLRGTVSREATVSLPGTVPPGATVSHLETVPSPGTVSTESTVSKDHAEPISLDLFDQPTVEISSNYFLMDADVFDVLAREQDPYEQLVYGYLYRQSYGRNRRMCFVGLKSLIENCRLSKNSVRRTLTRLEQKKHIEVVERVNQRNMKGTIYRVFLPCEISGLDSRTTFKERP